MKELDNVKKIFLADDVDDETRADNERKITEWEHAIIHNETFASWQEHDVTKQIMAEAKEHYRDFAQQLAENRTLTDKQRESLWAKQDAILWLISLAAKDARSELAEIQRDIRAALTAT